MLTSEMLVGKSANHTTYMAQANQRWKVGDNIMLAEGEVFYFGGQTALFQISKSDTLIFILH